MSAANTAVAKKQPQKPRSKNATRGIWAAVIVVALVGLGLGSKFIPNDDPRIVGVEKFNAETFGAERFPTIQENVAARATPAVDLAAAIAADPDAAATEFAVQSSGGPVYSTTFTGTFGEGKSGIYPVTIDGLPGDLTVRVQTGPAINGTEIRDASGEITFGEFTNQIDYQNAAAALNDELKVQVLANIDTAALEGKTVTVTGAFTLINPASWLVTPVQMEVQ
ncbi:DUF2291 family protein [Jonesiaceae bacterium BS-20]|uniref:DUF2291 family protein n=1 Tax=Jonesiaceae bacterium BS-20 TaxID=3120821 RepID=A0AAU7DTW9_9MICO